MAGRRGSRVQGTAQLRRALRNLTPEVESELGAEFHGIGARLLGRAKAETPVRTGWLRSLLDVKVLPKSLQIRLGLIRKAARRKGFYGYILDEGRKAGTVKARRRRADGTISQYMMRVKGIDRERWNFVFGRRKDFMANELDRLSAAVQRALSRVARGAQGND